MPQEFWFYARFPFDLRRIASAPFFLWHASARLVAVARVHSLPGMVGNFLISVDILPPRAPFFATCRRGLLGA
jgi:hypothetical protein